VCKALRHHHPPPPHRAPLPPARFPLLLKCVFHCYLSSRRFYFCSETFHSRLLSRCAALLSPCGRDGAVFTEGRARAHISCPWSVESRSEWQLHLSCYETSNRQQSASPIALSAGNAIYPREKDRGLPPRVHVLKGGLQVLHRTFRSPSPGSPSGKVARSS